VEQATIRNTTRQVHGASGIRVNFHVKRLDFAVFGNTNLVLKVERMTATTGEHVLVTIEDDSDWAVQLVCSERGGG
jgi:hypothetical protein